ncbi:MAG TPA: Asp-tRNA(Asn)/Glu-tRNA(Gln) amidotransferase subunit GatA [Vicinamibacterales bacterium]|jgi:aspartyl-tRNA(Asn)/glutamyl-tRNA(Gln) amidotransferase subunit A
MTPAQGAAAIRDVIVSGARSAEEICREALVRIEQENARLNAFTAVGAEQALGRARALDALRARSRDALNALPLAGVPVAVKDNLCTRELPTTACSRILAGYRSPYDATVVSRLESAGAIIVGKTNCDEFAMGSSNESSAAGPVHNPWDLDRTPGGSSGGSAAAVAAALVPIALGSDTGGSVRQPAALCGVVGLKPTYGRVSRYGLIAFASSLDQVGPIGRRVEDVARALSVLAGEDPADATSSREAVPDYSAALTGDVRGVRIGVPKHLLQEGVDPDVLQATTTALETLRARGAHLVDVQLPRAAYAIPTYYLIATAEAGSNLARYDGVRYGARAPGTSEGALAAMYRKTRDLGFGAEVKRRILLGTYVLSAGYYEAYYVKAQQVRTLIAEDYTRAFAQVDAIALPTAPAPAFRLGEQVNDPLRMYLNDVFTVSANLAGLPAVSVPCGLTRAGLPIGLHVTGRPFEEETILRMAEAYERDRGAMPSPYPDGA